MAHVQRGRAWELRDPGAIFYVKQAMAAFLEYLYSNANDTFLEILGRIFADFSKRSFKSIDFSEVRDSLLKLGYSENAINGILPEQSEIETGHLHNQILTSDSQEAEITKNICFVLMPFDKKFDSIYNSAIKTTVEGAGFSCTKADEIFGTKPIIDDIMEYIQNARVLIADLTGKNPNVFYELGIAHAKSKDVILITQNMEDIPFDVRHLRCIDYEDSIAGSDTLKEKLRSTLKKVLDKDG